MNKIFSVLLFSAVILSACNSGGKSNGNIPGQLSEAESTMKTYCFACHNPRTPSDGLLIAPPLVATKYYYQEKYESRDEFVKAMSKFIKFPQFETSVKQEWVNRFKLMPFTYLTDEEIKSVVEFMYDNPIEEPAWFKEHFEEMHKKPWVNE